MDDTLWKLCLARLEHELSEQQLNTWVRPLQAIVEEIGKLVERGDAKPDTFGVVVLIDEVGPYPGLVRAIGHHYKDIVAHIREELKVDRVVLAVAGTGAMKFVDESGSAGRFLKPVPVGDDPTLQDAWNDFFESKFPQWQEALDPRTDAAFGSLVRNARLQICMRDVYQRWNDRNPLPFRLLTEALKKFIAQNGFADTDIDSETKQGPLRVAALAYAAVACDIGALPPGTELTPGKKASEVAAYLLRKCGLLVDKARYDAGKMKWVPRLVDHGTPWSPAVWRSSTRLSGRGLTRTALATRTRRWPSRVHSCVGWCPRTSRRLRSL